MESRKALACALALVLLLASACGGQRPITRFTFASAERVIEPEVLGEIVAGKDCFSQFFLQVLLTPPWRVRRADHSLAMANAMANAPEANVLLDVVLRVDVSQYGLFQRTCAVVTGRPGRIP